MLSPTALQFGAVTSGHQLSHTIGMIIRVLRWPTVVTYLPYKKLAVLRSRVYCGGNLELFDFRYLSWKIWSSLSFRLSEWTNINSRGTISAVFALCSVWCLGQSAVPRVNIFHIYSFCVTRFLAGAWPCVHCLSKPFSSIDSIVHFLNKHDESMLSESAVVERKRARD